MTPTTLKEKLASGEPLKLIDVREPSEFASGDGIADSENIPMGEMFVRAGSGTLPRDQKIVTICSKGMRCEIVARELREKGFDIESLEGGLAAYRDAA